MILDKRTKRQALNDTEHTSIKIYICVCVKMSEIIVKT
jgi:hypothetical protein